MRIERLVKSKMLSVVKRPIFAHDLVNPPAEDRNCDVNLLLTNSKGRINLVKESVGLQTRYSLSILDPSSLGLSTSEQNTVNRFIRDLVLASNLLLRHAALSTLEGDLAESHIEFKQSESKVVVEDTPQGKHITITETIMLRDSVHVTIGFTEEIDEDRLAFNLGLINKVNKNKLPKDTTLELVNLKKALNEYENAMSVFDRLMIFKHLFNSIELAVNWDGIDRRGSVFDTEVATTASLQVLEVTGWRKFYDRTKHVDRTPKDITAFIRGMENLPSLLMPLRLASETLIIDRLKRL